LNVLLAPLPVGPSAVASALTLRLLIVGHPLLPFPVIVGFVVFVGALLLVITRWNVGLRCLLLFRLARTLLLVQFAFGYLDGLLARC